MGSPFSLINGEDAGCQNGCLEEKRLLTLVIRRREWRGSVAVLQPHEGSRGNRITIARTG